MLFGSGPARSSSPVPDDEPGKFSCTDLELPAELVHFRPGECHRYHLTLSPGQYWVRLDELGIDVVLIADITNNSHRVDMPVGRFAVENIGLHVKNDTSVIIQVESDDDFGVSNGQYRLAIRKLDVEESGIWAALDETRLATNNYVARNWLESAAALTRASDLWRAASEPSLSAWTLHAGAYIAMYPLRNSRDSFDDALILLNQSKKLWDEMDRPINRLAVEKDIGQVNFWMENYEIAEGLLREIVESDLTGTGPGFLKGVALNDLGYIAISVGDPVVSLSNYRDAIDKFLSNGETLEAQNTRHNLAILTSETGDIAEAIRLMESVRLGWHNVDEPVRAAISHTVLVNLYFETGDLDKALQNYAAAIEVFEHDPALENRAAALELIFARIMLALGRWEEAAISIQKALHWATRLDNKRITALALSTLANIAQQSKSPGTTIELLNQAKGYIAQQGASLTKLSIDSALARAHFDAGNFLEAKQLLEAVLENSAAYPSIQANAVLLKAEQSLIEDPRAAESRARKALRDFERLQDPVGQVAAQNQIAAAHRAQGNWAAEQTALKLALGQLRETSATLSLPRHRSQFIAQQRALLDQLIASIHRQSTIDGQDRTLEIIVELERRKLSGLGLSNSTNTVSVTGSKEALWYKYNKARQAYSRALQERALGDSAPGAGGASTARPTLNQLLQKFELAQVSLLSQPRLPKIDLDEDYLHDLLDKLATQGRVILYVHVGQEASRLYRFFGDDISSISLPGETELASQVTATLEYLSNPGMSMPEKTQQLITSLLPLSGDTRADEVFVISDGSLAALPLGSIALLNAGPEPGDVARWIQLPSLASAERFDQLASKSGELSGERVLLIGDPVTDFSDSRIASGTRKGGAVRLPASLREMELISQKLGVDRRNIATGFAATKESVTNLESPLDILHISAHGTLDSGFPAGSGVLLTSVTPTGEPTPGHLGWADLRSTHLPIGLVFLSGCTTASGELLPGDGVFGITRSFLDAGASAVVSSYWRVGDEATADFAVEFYKHIGQGLSGPESLKRTMLAIKHQPGRQHPYYWAGFAYHGFWNLKWEKFQRANTVRVIH